LASSGFTNSRISACGTGVAPTVSVSLAATEAEKRASSPAAIRVFSRFCSWFFLEK
jgi:hypothetical protein